MTVWLIREIDQTPEQVPFNDESDEDSDDEGYDLRDVSSDVEMDPAELMGVDGEDSDDTDAKYVACASLNPSSPY